MKSQITLIQEASRAYILSLTPRTSNSMTDRFAVYVETEHGLECLWPATLDDGKREELLPGQVYSKRNGYPAYHFALGGCGFSKEYEIKCTLREINPQIEVSILRGWSPSSL